MFGQELAHQIMKFSHSDKIRISEHVLSQEVSGETVLLDLTSEEYFGLDPIATRIWQLLNDQKSIGVVIEEIILEYDVSRDQLEKDIAKLLEQLLQTGLIELQPEAV